jgi:hypothetical protein
MYFVKDGNAYVLKSSFKLTLLNNICTSRIQIKINSGGIFYLNFPLNVSVIC